MRLLGLLPGSHNEPLRCILPVDEAPEYEAISYVLGDDAKSGLHNLRRRGQRAWYLSTGQVILEYLAIPQDLGSQRSLPSIPRKYEGQFNAQVTVTKNEFPNF
jgi:hypothetical protein